MSTDIATIEDREYISGLEIIKDPGDNHNTCLSGTRIHVLDSIRTWMKDPNSTQVWWVTDVAGAGKSTIAKHLSDEWRREGSLAGSFFFNKNRTESTTTRLFCNTIAAQLASRSPQLRSSVINGIKDLDQFSSFRDKLQRLVVDPLKDQDQNLVLVIDALDECNEKDRNDLLQNLFTSLPHLPHLKVLITSRPEPDLALRLEIYKSETDNLHDPKLKSNQHDIAIFVREELKHLVPNSKLTWEEIDSLTKRVNCLFILASTACGAMKRPVTSHKRMLKELLDPKTNPLRDINSLYLTILNNACHSDRFKESFAAEQRETMIQVLKIILAAAIPLAVPTIDLLLDVENQVVTSLSSVLSVLDNGVVLILHPTFREFLENEKVAQNLYIDIRDAHRLLAKRCLATMMAGLKFNICRLESSFYLNSEVIDMKERVTEFISRELQYGSIYWPYHVTRCGDSSDPEIIVTIAKLVKTPYPLYWMEIVSAIGQVSRALEDLQVVKHWIKVCTLFYNKSIVS